MQPPAYSDELLVALRFGIYGRQCLSIELFSVLPVKAHGHEVLLALNSVEPGWHHGDPGGCGKFVIGHLKFGRIIGLIAELEQVVIIVFQPRYLSASYLPVFSVDGDDSLGLTSACRRADGEQ